VDRGAQPRGRRAQLGPTSRRSPRSSRAPSHCLAIVDGLALGGYHDLHSTRGEVLRRLGRIDEARDAYATALGLVRDEAERRLLTRQQTALRPVAS
jgi:predicted RNA polymerase sigma factor